jgi:hypothetical protein
VRVIHHRFRCPRFADLGFRVKEVSEALGGSGFFTSSFQFPCRRPSMSPWAV